MLLITKMKVTGIKTSTLAKKNWDSRESWRWKNTVRCARSRAQGKNRVQWLCVGRRSFVIECGVTRSNVLSTSWLSAVSTFLARVVLSHKNVYKGMQLIGAWKDRGQHRWGGGGGGGWCTRKKQKVSTSSRRCTPWCSEIGSPTSLDACNSGASSDLSEPSLHQAVHAHGTQPSAYLL